MAEGELTAFDEGKQDEPGGIIDAWIFDFAILAHF